MLFQNHPVNVQLLHQSNEENLSFPCFIMLENLRLDTTFKPVELEIELLIKWAVKVISYYRNVELPNLRN